MTPTPRSLTLIALALLLTSLVLVQQASAAEERLPTIFIAGDSTAARSSDPDQQGWAEPFATYFDARKVRIENRARGGRSSRTFITEGLWDELLAELQPGDIVLIQFGHNDGGAINREPPGSDRPLRARGVLPGLGEESEEIDNAVTGEREVVRSFGWYMRKMIREVRERGATPVALSLTARNLWEDGQLERGSGLFGRWTSDLAKEEGIPFVDLNQLVVDLLQSFGPEATAKLYTKDYVHFNDEGADLHARLVVAGLRGTEPGLVDDWLSEEGRQVAPQRAGKRVGWQFEEPARFALSPADQSQRSAPVGPEDAYSPKSGYGFDLGRAPGEQNQPFYFSVRAREGNYRVTVAFGDEREASDNTVKAESRRLMVETARTRAGELTTRSFVVNVRDDRLRPPERFAPGGAKVLLNERETGRLHWDDKLTLEFNGDTPRPRWVEIQSIECPTIYLVGDSTVTDQPEEPAASWGQMLPRFFGDTVAIANHAESGETLKSFISGLRLAKALENMKPGDYLFIQFGHNDQKEQWPQTYVEADTTYKAYLKVYIAEARRRGATPVLVTSMQRRVWDEEGRIRNTLGGYPKAVREVASEEGVALIDLERMSVDFYEALGPDQAPFAFTAGGKDATHHNNYGAYQLARCVVQGIIEADLDLARHLLASTGGYDPADPDRPDRFRLAASPNWTELRPLGD